MPFNAGLWFTNQVSSILLVFSIAFRTVSHSFLDIFSLRLDSSTARKTRDTLVKSIYEHLFQLIMSCINDTLMSNSKQNQEYNSKISILDIAGFGNIFYFLLFPKLIYCPTQNVLIHR